MQQDVAESLAHEQLRWAVRGFGRSYDDHSPLERRDHRKPSQARQCLFHRWRSCHDGAVHQALR
jgi:hypothetical protein